MKKNSLKKVLDATFLIILVLFCILVYATYSRTEQVNEHRLAVNRTNNINDMLEKILSSTTDVETGTRGYIITGENQYLSVYEDGGQKLKIWVDSLRDLYAHDATENQRIDVLQRLVDRKKDISQLTIKTRNELGMQAAANLIKTGRGKFVMDSIRNCIYKYQQQELRHLSAHLNATEENVQKRNLNVIFFALFMFLSIFLAYLKLRQMANIIVRDRNIQQNLMNELTYQNQQLNDFANITSHNLRSPASNISALVASAEENSTIEEYKMLFEMLKKVAQNLNDSLNQLIDVLHIKRHKDVEKENVTFQQLLDRAIDSLQGEIHTSGATITSDFSQAPEIMYVKIYLDSIMHNLLGNALKYRSADRQPNIKIWTEEKQGLVVLHVADNGLGIDMARHSQKLFAMGHTFHKHPDAKGIGLFMTKTQIESLNGRITATSTVNVGSTFTVNFA